MEVDPTSAGVRWGRTYPVVRAIVGHALDLTDAYSSAYSVCMRTTVDLDEALVRSALAETHARTKTEVIEMGLRALLEREARRRLRALEGKIPDLAAVRRRRS